MNATPSVAETRHPLYGSQSRRSWRGVLVLVVAFLGLTAALSACSPEQYVAWLETHGIDSSTYSPEEIEAGAAAATAWWEAAATSTVPPRPSTTVYVPRCVIPEYICRRESGFSYTALNRSSMAGGMYQFLPSTWNGVARQIAPQWVGTYPHQAPPYVQDQFAAWLWNGGKGCSHWSAC